MQKTSPFGWIFLYKITLFWQFLAAFVMFWIFLGHFWVETMCIEWTSGCNQLWGSKLLFSDRLSRWTRKKYAEDQSFWLNFAVQNYPFLAIFGCFCHILDGYFWVIPCMLNGPQVAINYEGLIAVYLKFFIVIFWPFFVNFLQIFWVVIAILWYSLPIWLFF